MRSTSCRLGGGARRPQIRAILLIPVLLCCGCLPRQLDGRSDPAAGPGDPDYDRVVQVRFLGVSGFTLRRGRDVIMTAPLYSNPTMDDVVSNPIAPNRAAVAAELAKIARDLPEVRAILVGHSHYDHLMDVPLVWEKTRPRNPEGAMIYGGRTTKHVLAGYANSGSVLPHPPLSRIQPLNEVADTTLCSAPSDCVGGGCRADPPPGQAGTWITVPETNERVRFMALCSKHPPQFLKKHHLWRGCVNAERCTPPAEAADYREGEVFAYLIDFLDERGRPAYRVYYQDAPTEEPWGYAPAPLIKEKAVDLALLCGGSFDAVRHPEDIVENLRAAQVIVHHWEDFFDPEHARLKVLPFLPIEEFYSALLRKLGGDERRLHILRPDVLKVFRSS